MHSNIPNFKKTSVVSYPNRDNRYGDNSYRGNCTGLLIKDMIEFFKLKLFVDACEGSKTSRHVCKEMGINYVGLDLYNGNDFTKDSILKELPYPATMCFTHPPYHDMIKYSGEQWNKGKGKTIGDTSQCNSVEEFLAKSQVMLLNQREATASNGIYTTLIGDQKVKGICKSYQADFIKMLPKSELLNVVIKMQHNTMSANTNYSNRNFIPISHEYLILWKKKAQSIYQIGYEIASDLQRAVATTWRGIIRVVMMQFNGAITLSKIYEEVEKVAGTLIAHNQNYKAKIRQILQKHHTNVSRGIWAL
jgi:hypothetical protein